jgi:hypothetical protein
MSLTQRRSWSWTIIGTTCALLFVVAAVSIGYAIRGGPRSDQRQLESALTHDYGSAVRVLGSQSSSESELRHALLTMFYLSAQITGEDIATITELPCKRALDETLARLTIRIISDASFSTEQDFVNKLINGGIQICEQNIYIISQGLKQKDSRYVLRDGEVDVDTLRSVLDARVREHSQP